MKFDITGIESANILADLTTEILRAIARADMSFFIYISTDPDRQDLDVASNLPGLHHTPGTDATSLFDPFLDYCCNGYQPTFTGADFLPDYPYLRDPDRAFIQRAADEHGWRTGLGVPVRLRGSARYGGFNFGSTLRRDDFLAKIQPLEADLRVFALLAHRRIEEVLRPAPIATDFRNLLVSSTVPDASLSQCESEILFLISQGYTTKEIARLCTISPHTAAEYRKSLYPPCLGGYGTFSSQANVCKRGRSITTCHVSAWVGFMSTYQTNGSQSYASNGASTGSSGATTPTLTTSETDDGTYDLGDQPANSPFGNYSYVGSFSDGGHTFLVFEDDTRPGFHTLFSPTASPVAPSPFPATYEDGDFVLDTMPFSLCFGSGTLIETPFGETAVEDLKIGDMICATSGAVIPVKWIGRQTIHKLLSPACAQPVRIRAKKG